LNAPDWEAIDLLSMTSGAIDVRGAPIDPIARRLWGVPVVLNQALGDDVGLTLAKDAVIVDHDGEVDVRWSDAVNDDFSKKCRGRSGCRSTSPVRS
jgi:hypothetical protein